MAGIPWIELFRVVVLFEEPGLGSLLAKKGGKYLGATLWFMQFVTGRSNSKWPQREG